MAKYETSRPTRNGGRSHKPINRRGKTEMTAMASTTVQTDPFRLLINEMAERRQALGTASFRALTVGISPEDYEKAAKSSQGELFATQDATKDQSK